MATQEGFGVKPGSVLFVRLWIGASAHLKSRNFQANDQDRIRFGFASCIFLEPSTTRKDGCCWSLWFAFEQGGPGPEANLNPLPSFGIPEGFIIRTLHDAAWARFSRPEQIK